jgi:hypothetical protein
MFHWSEISPKRLYTGLPKESEEILIGEDHRHRFAAFENAISIQRRIADNRKWVSMLAQSMMVNVQEFNRVCFGFKKGMGKPGDVHHVGETRGRSPRLPASIP